MGSCYYTVRIWVLFIIGFGTMCAMNLYIGVLCLSYDFYKQREEHYYNQFVVSVIKRFLARKCFMEGMITCGLNTHWHPSNEDGIWIMWHPKESPASTSFPHEF